LGKTDLGLDGFLQEKKGKNEDVTESYNAIALVLRQADFNRMGVIHYTMTSKHARKDVIYRRCCIDVPDTVKAGIDKYKINVTATCVAALREEIEHRKKLSGEKS
jgi:hypothetical protein